MPTRPEGVKKRIRHRRRYLSERLQDSPKTRRIPSKRRVSIAHRRSTTPSSTLAHTPIGDQKESSPIETRLSKLEHRVEHHDFLNRTAIQPLLSRFAREIEGLPSSVESPPASSARYELSIKLKELLVTIENIVNEFQDLRVRLSHYTAFQRQMGELLKLSRIRNNKVLRSAFLTIHDASYSVYSEDLTFQQAEVLLDWIVRLRDIPTVDKDSVRSLDRSLREAGFETIPSDKFEYLPHG